MFEFFSGVLLEQYNRFHFGDHPTHKYSSVMYLVFPSCSIKSDSQNQTSP